MISEELKKTRKEMLDEIEKRLLKGQKPEDSAFCCHSSEDRIVLSHALFWVMTGSYKGKVAKEKYFLLLRQYEEEMLDAYLAEDSYFPELLRYCNILFGALPVILRSVYNLKADKHARRLAATAIVAGGYGGDMPEELCNGLLDDMDYHFNKVKCRKIEQMLPLLNKMVEEEAIRCVKSNHFS